MPNQPHTPARFSTMLIVLSFVAGMLIGMCVANLIMYHIAWPGSSP